MFYSNLKLTVPKNLVHFSPSPFPRSVSFFWISFLYAILISPKTYLLVLSQIAHLCHALQTTWLRPPVTLVLSNLIVTLYPHAHFSVAFKPHTSQLTILFSWPLVHYTSQFPFYFLSPFLLYLLTLSSSISEIWSPTNISLNTILIK